MLDLENVKNQAHGSTQIHALQQPNAQTRKCAGVKAMPREKAMPLPNKPLVVRMNQVTLDWLNQQSVEQDRAKCYIVARIVEKYVEELKAKEAVQQAAGVKA